MLLISNLFKDDQALKNGANFDVHHILPEAVGAHVRKVQTALLICDDADIDRAELDSGRFGPSTTRAVVAFKTRRAILNYRKEIDPIVGINTIRRLDQELVRKQDEQPVIRKTQDIVVHIVGARLGAGQGLELTDGSGQLMAGVQPVSVFNLHVESEEYLRYHLPLKHFQWTGGQDAQDPSQRIADRIAQHHDSGGNVLVVGLSAGGPNVLQVGQILNGRGIRLAYAGLCDGAFQSSADSLRTANFTPGRGEDFFQTLGQEVKPQEFHGPVIGGGFSPTDFSRHEAFVRLKLQLQRSATGFLGRTQQQFIDAVHLLAVQEGYRRASISMNRLLQP